MIYTISKVEVVLGFYRPILQSILKLAVVIRKVLSNQVATSTCERSFNISGNVLSVRQEKKPPSVPSFRVLGDEDVEEVEDEDNVRERQEVETVAWAAFFDVDEEVPGVV